MFTRCFSALWTSNGPEADVYSAEEHFTVLRAELHFFVGGGLHVASASVRKAIVFCCIVFPSSLRLYHIAKFN
jgi:hypothetical protein